MGWHSHSPNCQRAPMDRGYAPQHFCAAAATPKEVQNSPQAPVGASPTY